MGKTKIAWTDETSNPIIAISNESLRGWACVKCDAGCEHCYAERLNRTRKFGLGTGLDYTLRDISKVRVELDWKEIERIERIRKHRLIFLCSMTDLFANFVSDVMIAQVFASAAIAGRNATFQTLTKRADRMRRTLADSEFIRLVREKVSVERIGAETLAYPLKNVWVGMSVCDRHGAWRIRELRDTPAAVRFLSVEPLLEDLGALDLTDIDWVIVGGESGPHFRKMDLDWARAIRDQCVAAGVPFFFKQESAARPGMNPTLDGVEWHQFPTEDAR